MEKMFEIVKVQDGTQGAFNLTIRRIGDGKEVVCTDVMIWDEDVESLEGMFVAVEEGEWLVD